MITTSMKPFTTFWLTADVAEGKKVTGEEAFILLRWVMVICVGKRGVVTVDDKEYSL